MEELKNKAKLEPLSLAEKLALTFAVVAAAILLITNDLKCAFFCLIVAILMLLNACVYWLWLIFKAVVLKEDDK
ncbi:hypothetical protein [Ligilactobacillus animalis]|uniref:hypothetical protein n=1 Tax=Ligilactobacillus animalis TaxID=1605 RepID=UPI00384F84F9